MTATGLGLGSNIGDTRAHLAAAIAALPEHGVQVLALAPRCMRPSRSAWCSISPTSSTPACGSRPTSGRRTCSTRARRWSARSGGRAGRARHGPRVIDVDLLLLGDLEYSSERLTLPHAETGSRRFVLVPLLELDPDLTLPAGRRLADTLAALGEPEQIQSVRRVAPPLM